MCPKQILVEHERWLFEVAVFQIYWKLKTWELKLRFNGYLRIKTKYFDFRRNHTGSHITLILSAPTEMFLNPFSSLLVVLWAIFTLNAN